MYKSKSIKNLAGALMLCIFLFSITPKQWLHDVVTHHKDSQAVSFDGKQALSTAGFHCDCDNLVVQAPFINYDLTAGISIPEFPVQHQSAVIGSFFSTYHFFSSLRGPPNGV